MSLITKTKLELKNYFELHGYLLNNDGLVVVTDLLKEVSKIEKNEWLERLTDILQKQSLESAIIDADIITKVIKECSDIETQENEALTIINAFTIPRFIFNLEHKKFEKDNCMTTSLSSIADEKWRLFHERYQLVMQRTKRHRLFSNTASTLSGSTFTLKPVEFYLSSTSCQSNCLILGMLTQFSHRSFFIEDPTGYLPINLTNAVYKDGLFTECSIVLAEGTYDDGTFQANAIGFPPAELASSSITHFGNLNYFGGNIHTAAKLSDKIKFLEDKNSDAMLVFLSDVWLDQIKVMEKLKILFAGYSEMPPTAFILIGNFISTYKGKTVFKVLKECLKNLSNMLSEFTQLIRKSKFIFVPGPNDAGLTTILPRPPVSKWVTQDFEKQIPSAIFTTNPCRIQFCTQEIVVFREDLVSKLCRNSINSPWQQDKEIDIPSLCAKTLVSNAHLCPLPLNASPVYWAFDHALKLYPLPDLVVIGDKCEPYETKNTGCTFINPGSFPRTNFSFKVYMPSTRQVQDSQISD